MAGQWFSVRPRTSNTMKASTLLLVCALSAFLCPLVLGGDRIKLSEMDNMEAVATLEQAGANGSLSVLLEGIEHQNMDVRFAAAMQMRSYPYSRRERAAFWRSVLTGTAVWSYAGDDNFGVMAQMRIQQIMKSELTELLGYRVEFDGALTPQDRSRWVARLDTAVLATPSPKARLALTESTRGLVLGKR